MNERVLSRCDELLGPCSVESFVTDLLLGYPLDGSRQECADTVSSYLAGKFSKEVVKLPAQTEAALLATVGNMFLEDPSEVETARQWFRKARLELVGHPEKQEYLTTCASDGSTVDVMRLLGSWPVDPPPSSSEEKSAKKEDERSTGDAIGDSKGAPGSKCPDLA